jgi:RND family efflux transporter MFP subunit
MEAGFYKWPDTVHIQGSLQPDEQVVVGAKVPGRVAEVRVDLGSVVRQGDVLAVLDPAEFELRVQQAQAQLSEACAALGMEPDDSENELDRLKAPPVALERALLDEATALVQRARGMIEQRVTTPQELERAEAQQRVAAARYASALNGVDQKIATVRIRRAELALARQQQSDATLVAPFDGVVQARHVAPGGYLTVGLPVVSMVRNHPLRFRGSVPERVALRVAVGQALTISIEGQPEPITGTITRISPGLDVGSRSLLIEADVPNPDNRLRGGLFAEADIVVDPDAQALAIPAGAVFEFAGVRKVWVVDDGKAREQGVTTGRTTGALVEIVSGLSPGAQVIADSRTGRSGPVTVAATAAAPATGRNGSESAE